ncbi:hypothetical protein DPMN_193554 [Dreissena polymorpha]|uniref:Peptidase M12B domain-containing protein n=1 Tax=Dreissena polymorpha TaxID=45954 RepID=A0A9D3XVG5_DREPO|nr:hypothetical protein DPMN_193554 [Dreissena polymorpha]
MYQTLKQYNNLLYRDATALPQNIAVQIVNVVFPPGDTDYSFVTYNLNQGVLDWAVLYSFVSFLQTYISPVPYDHATFVTGFDLRYYGAAINGDAFLRSMCIQWVFDYGYHSSIAAFNADAIETMAQLLGYGFGMGVDGWWNSCQRKFIMSSVWPQESSSTFPDRRTFSQCSSDELESFT